MTLASRLTYVILIVVSFGTALLLLIPHYIIGRMRPPRCPFCGTNLEQVYERGRIEPPPVEG